MISAIMLGLFLLLMLIGMPVSIAIMLATIIGMLIGGYDLLAVPQFMAAATKSPFLLAIPFFILAANLMNALGITQRIFDFATALAGRLRGGLAQVNVVASMIFAGISGAAVADAAGLGTIEIKAMKDSGYSLEFAAAITLASATIGPIIPPSVMMLIYAIIAGVSPAAMFLAGILPGFLIGLILMITIYIQVTLGLRDCPPPVKFSLKRLIKTSKDGVLSLLSPFIILWGMVSGVVTPTEAGVLAVFYSLLLGFIYRSFNWKVVRKALLDTVKTSSLILYIIAVSSVLAWVMVNEGTAYDIAEWLGKITDNPLILLAIINVFLLILGAILETLPAMLIAVPVLLPAIDALGIDRVHFGIIVIFNLLIGIITPPMGIGLYILAAISGVRVDRLVIASIPYMITLIIALIAITYIPILTLYLPEHLLN
jgi:tripartite ATP-independent transporter DctM subunit|tara:strand:+ start:433 stop:1713 length:1281 start_codon:yes stop_codon:yes gene_type:complete